MEPPKRGRDPRATLARILQRYALAGLFGVFVLFAGTLAVAAWRGYDAAKAAGRDVLFRRAVEAADSFSRAARGLRLEREGEALSSLATEIAQGELGLALVSSEGRVLAGSKGAGLEAGQRVAVPASLKVTRLRPPAAVPPVVLELGSDASAPALVLWRPLLPPPPPGSAFAPPFVRPPWPPPEPAPPVEPPPPPEGGPEPFGGPPFHGPPPFGGGHAPIVRVVVPETLASPLLSPARNTLVLALIASPLFLLAGILFLRAARRARRAERHAERRRSLSSLGEMSAILAHEIRTPLSSIKGNAQLLAEERAEDRRLASMIGECGRLERLVDGLLDYARPMPLMWSRCDPDRLVERAAEIVLPKAEHAKVRLVLDPCGLGERLFADGDRLVQVLVNLATNAIESNEVAGRAHEPVVMRAERAGASVRFEVLDRGAGLPNAARSLIYKPFYSTKERGTGLGLAVSRQIAEQHGGRLHLGDRPEGQGVRAVLEVPLEGRAPVLEHDEEEGPP